MISLDNSLKSCSGLEEDGYSREFCLPAYGKNFSMYSVSIVSISENVGFHVGLPVLSMSKDETPSKKSGTSFDER